MYTYHHETWHTDSPWIKDVSYWFRGIKVKGQYHNALMTWNGFWHMIAFPLHLSLWNLTHRLPMSQECSLLILWSKGQRSRSQCIHSQKRFRAHNCFLFTQSSPNFTQILAMSRWSTVLNLGSKGQSSRSHALMTGNVFWCIIAFPFPLSPWNFTHRLPMRRVMCPIDFWVKRSKV